MRITVFRHLLRSITWPLWCVIVLLSLAIIWPQIGLNIDLMQRNLPPNLIHPFGTDWLGRDMLTRSLKGLLNSLMLAIVAVLCSSVLALILAMIATLNRWLAQLVELLVDVFLSLPHLLLLILFALAFGGVSSGGASFGVVAAIALSHWPRLTRLLLFDMQAVTHSTYFQLAQQFGQPKSHLLIKHLIPHVAPQWLTGALIMLPQALSHMAGLTFLGFGLEPSVPSMGVILSQASRYLLAGEWWLAVLPGALLVVCILLLSLYAQQVSQRIRGQIGTMSLYRSLLSEGNHVTS